MKSSRIWATLQKSSFVIMKRSWIASSIWPISDGDFLSTLLFTVCPSDEYILHLTKNCNALYYYIDIIMSCVMKAFFLIVHLLYTMIKTYYTNLSQLSCILPSQKKEKIIMLVSLRSNFYHKKHRNASCEACRTVLSTLPILQGPQHDLCVVRLQSHGLVAHVYA